MKQFEYKFIRQNSIPHVLKGFIPTLTTLVCIWTNKVLMAGSLRASTMVASFSSGRRLSNDTTVEMSGTAQVDCCKSDKRLTKLSARFTFLPSHKMSTAGFSHGG